MTSCPEAWAEDFGIWEKQSWVPSSERGSWDSDLGEARQLCEAPGVGWVESWRCKSSQHRKIVSLSPHVDKPFNSKVIKFRTWTNFVYRIPYVYFPHPYIWLCNTSFKCIYSVLFAFPWRPKPSAVCSKLCKSDSAWAGVVARSTRAFV